MTVKELKDALSSLDDNAIVLIPAGYDDENIEFYEADIVGAGYCDPDSDRTDGLYIELRGVTLLPEMSGKCFQIIALCKTTDRNAQGGVPAYETG